MANLTTEREKRDFLATEIEKRIVGPGFAQDVYLCDVDAEDEILSERPQVVYTSGILFSKGVPENPALEGDDDDSDVESLSDSDGQTDVAGDDAEGNNDYAGDFDDDLANERGGFSPDRIGLITCLRGDADVIKASVGYGRYRVLDEEEWSANIHLRLDERCSLAELRTTFAYYDREARDLLDKLGANSMFDLFDLDEVNLTISPKRKLCYREQVSDDRVRVRYVYASSFPSLPRNRAGAILLKLIQESPTQSLATMSWDVFIEEIRKIDSVPGIKAALDLNGWMSFESHLIYDAADNKVSLSRKFNQGDVRLSDYVYIPDPVKDYVLDKLLEYRFFKRRQVIKEAIVPLRDGFGHEDLGDGAILHWKVFPSTKNRSKYVRLLLQNCTVANPRSGEIPQMFQVFIKIESDKVVSYSEPQTSVIDEEFTLTEKLYSDELFFGKGVNCAVEWESTEGNPSWVRTIYSPKVIVRSFSTSVDKDAVDEVCRIHDLSVWGEPDEVIIRKLRVFADEYASWAAQQQAAAQDDSDLLGVLALQQEFLARFNDNIDYLEKNNRAFSCFRIANTAMYIQMLLSRDPRFKSKGRDKSTYAQGDDFYDDCWNFFEDPSNPAEKPTYRPFQLAFLVMNVKSTFESSDPYRNDNVDLIWFPTGGGKTEAYLALTALTIAERRTSGYADVSGVSVIMRYTLRLLTAQQFERASYLICALDYLRDWFMAHPDFGYSLGTIPITLGMWIGKASSPNRTSELYHVDRYIRFFKEKTMESNPFPIVYCPWCGCNLVGNDGTIGYDRSQTGARKDDVCLNRGCHFHRGIPIYYIDEQLYSKPPTLLFATVDKFAMLNTKEAGKLFGVGTARRKPDLIIQDELHLISGPLGSLVGLYETFVEELATEKDADGNVIRSPKIIASTATTRNTAHLIQQLYKREVRSFPASGIRYDDNFFSHIISKEKSKRLYMGISPTGHSSSELEIKAVAAELVAKEKLITEWVRENGIPMDTASIATSIIRDKSLISELDLYWTQVLYYINLKTLGRTHSRISQEIRASVINMRRYSRVYPAFRFILDGFYTRNTEFTSRQNSAQIKQLLVKAEEPTTIISPQPSSLRVESQMDIVQATNMISVGIDIDRWNVMMMVGQPLTTAEYIQASSRAGRHHHGLIVNLFNPMRARELSFYENYSSYHQVFYKFVEPLSATTFTEMTLDMLIRNLYVGYMVLLKGYTYISQVTMNDVDSLYAWLETRAHGVGASPSLLSSLNQCVRNTYERLGNLNTSNRSYKFSDIVGDRAQSILADVELERLMSSLRVIDKNVYLKYEN